MTSRFPLVLSLVLATVACDPGEDDNNNNTVLASFDHEGGVITGGATWAAGTHNVLGSITIEDGVLQVAACSTLKMANDAVIRVHNNGALKLIGREDCKVTVTSAKASPAPGDWSYIELWDTADSNNNVFTWAVIEYAGQGYGSIWLSAGAGLAMSNSTVQHSDHYGIQVESDVSLPGFVNNTLIANKLGPIFIHPNDVGQLGVGVYQPNTVNGIQVWGGEIARDQTWLTLDTHYSILGSLNIRVDSGSAHLTLMPGTTLKMATGADVSISNNGGLTAVGTAMAPITFTSAKASPAAGDWGEIIIWGDSVDNYNQFDFAVIEYGGDNAGEGLIWVDSDASVQVTGSTLAHGGGYGLYVSDGAVLRGFTGNTLTNNAKGPIKVWPGAIDMLQAGVYTPNTIEGIQVNGGEAGHDATWRNLGTPYVFNGWFHVRSDVGTAHVTVEPGVTLKLPAGGGIDVGNNGGFTLAGTAEAHIVITSAKPSPSAGDWDDIDIWDDSVDAQNVFTYVDIMYGNGGDEGQIWVAANAGITLTNVTFAHAGTTAGSNPGCDVVKADAATSTVTLVGSTANVCAP